MNRLIFIKFLEDKDLVTKNLLGKILKEYKKNNYPVTFYKMFLQPLFYDVFNTNVNKRKSNIESISYYHNIPYLNGGLFRDTIYREKECDIENEILEKIITELLEHHSFTLNGDNESLNPDILGNVFEKTINYLTGTGDSDERKEKGAYYTPNDITSFITYNTIRVYVFERIKSILREMGWSEPNINGYNSLEDFIDNLPNPKYIKPIYNLVDEIKILDPACGSGHFLTTALKELVFIKKKLKEALGERDRHLQYKKDYN